LNRRISRKKQLLLETRLRESTTTYDMKTNEQNEHEKSQNDPT